MAVEDPAAARRRRIRRRLRHLISLIAVIGIVWYALTQLPGALDAADQLAGLEPSFLVAGVAAQVAALITYTLLTRALLPPRGRPSFWALLRIDLASLAASHVLPGGSLTAVTLRIVWLSSVGLRRADAVFAAVMQSVGSAIVLNVLLFCALVATIPTHGSNPLYVTAAAIGAALIATAAAVVFALTRGQRHVVRMVRAVTAHLPAVEPDAAERQIRRVAHNLKRLGAHRRRLAGAIGWATANWLLDAASLWIFLASFGYRARIDELLVAFGLAHVFAAIPLTAEGLGIVEGILISSLVGFGAPYSVAVVGVIGYRLVSYWLPVPIGGLAYLSLRIGPLRRLPPAGDEPQMNGGQAAAASATTTATRPGRRGQDRGS